MAKKSAKTNNSARVLVNEVKDRELAPEGTHVAQCVRILDLGTQVHPEWGPKRKINIGFELLEEQTTEGEPFLVFRTYNASLTPKSDLSKDISAWLGIKIGKGDEFDIDELLGKHCMVTVVWEDSGDTTYANVSTITSLPKSVRPPRAQSELQSLYLDDSFDQEIFDALPDWLQEKIAKTEEYQALGLAPVKSKGGKPSRAKAEEEEEEEEAPRRKAKPAPKKKSRR